jgi:hypothetical protein
MTRLPVPPPSGSTPEPSPLSRTCLVLAAAVVLFWSFVAWWIAGR